MAISRATRLLLLLVCFSLPFDSDAQQPDEAAEAKKPELQSLQGSWWSHFDGTPSEIGPRIELFLEGVRAEIPSLEPQNHAAALSALDAVRDNFSAYLALLDSADLTLTELPEPSASYSIEDLLRLAATLG